MVPSAVVTQRYEPSGLMAGHLLCGKHLDAEPLCLTLEPTGELIAGDAFGEARIVVQPLGDADLASDAGPLDHEGVDTLPCGVESGREPGRSAADDDEVVEPA